MKPGRPFLSAALVLLAASVLAQPLAALEDNQILPGAKRIASVSRGDLKGRCSRSGGSYVETSEEYGCATDNGWVYCEKSSGDCVGASGKTAQRRSRQPDVSGAGQRLRAPALRPPAAAKTWSLPSKNRSLRKP